MSEAERVVRMRAAELEAQDDALRRTTSGEKWAEAGHAAQILINAYAARSLDQALRLESLNPDKTFHRLVRMEVERLLRDGAV